MAVNITIRNVPDPVATALRQRAAANRRSLQQETLALLEAAVAPGAARVAEPAPSTYHSIPKRRSKSSASASATVPPGRLTMEQIWARARRLGEPSPPESAAIIRADRDARNRR